MQLNRELLLSAAALFGFSLDEAREVPAHEGGRNNVLAIGSDRILRISGLQDRVLQDYLAETEYVHYLASKGASVADALPSAQGWLVEVIDCDDVSFAVSMFQRAKGDQLADEGETVRFL